MAEINKPDLTAVWAQGGAVIAPSEAKVALGWTEEVPPHQWENWAQNRQDNALKYLYQKGVAEWDSKTEYFANRSFTNRNGVLYRAKTNNTNSDPLTSPNDWALVVDLSGVVSKSTTITGVGALTGGGDLTANRTIDASPATKASLARADTSVQNSQVVQGTGSSTANIMSQKAVTDNLNLKTDTSRQIIAGNGLSGGGTLAANRTLAIGTPSEVSRGSTNSVTSTSHTHALSAEVKASLAKADSALQVEDFCKNLPSQEINNPASWQSGVFVYGVDSETQGFPTSFSAILSAKCSSTRGLQITAGNTDLWFRRLHPSEGSNTWVRAWNEINFNPDTKVNTTTQVIAGTGLTGGGTLAANRTLSVVYGSTAGTAAQGNDSRIVNSVQTSGNQTIAGIKTFSSFPVTPSAAPTTNYQTANKKYVDDSAIGVGQTWVDVTSLRNLGVTYTNTEGRSIVVSARLRSSSGIVGIALYVQGVAADSSEVGAPTQGGINLVNVSAVVPAEATYRIEAVRGSGTLSVLELR